MLITTSIYADMFCQFFRLLKFKRFEIINITELQDYNFWTTLYHTCKALFLITQSDHDN